MTVELIDCDNIKETASIPQLTYLPQLNHEIKIREISGTVLKIVHDYDNFVVKIIYKT